ncbi:hypothetical protein TSUD_33150 [Trifolium subterraneum]|uniref:Uncharacterized protein n=1 Tax=Trifolium subterraneum TaxID=3900 RepID=A0A2Z6LUR2_TRISU|nr:hypothetical protein TSUD_33150 [Trifolium subterraneum]
MNKFSYWSVGNGREIDAWGEAWLDEGVHINELLSIPSHMIGMRVSELVDSDGNWNWMIFNNWMPRHLLKKIAAILPPNEEHDSDERIMAGGSKTAYSVALMYNNLCGFDQEEASSSWNKIWKLEVPERLAMRYGLGGIKRNMKMDLQDHINLYRLS